MTEAQYKIIADRMIEEHRKYGDRLRPGHWADVAARKVASHMADFREGEGQPIYTKAQVEKLVQTLRMAFNVIDEMNAEGFGPLTSKEGLEAFCALVDALDVFDPA